MLRQLITCNNTNILHSHNRSNLNQILKIDGAKFLGLRLIDNFTVLSANSFSRYKIKAYITTKWKESWCNYMRSSGNTDGLLSFIENPTDLIDKSSIPLNNPAKLVGSLCALLTGHTRLQLHTYKLKLTFSPTCICLEEDESPYHFVFTCKLYSIPRSCSMPSLDDWHSILSYIMSTGKLP